VPAIICKSMDEVLRRLRGLVSNDHHDRVNAVELARALRWRFMDDPSMRQRELAGLIGLHPSVVSRILRVLDLPEDLLDRVGSSQLRISADILGRIAGFHDRRWQAELVGALLNGKTEQSVRARLSQLHGEARPARFRVDHKCRYQTILTMRSRFKHLTPQQRHEVFLDAMAQDEQECELEEARALA
jgi:hypothetical protein